ncbi:YeeE/YedE family protein [Sphingobacterium shayense]|uniref:YeeE/YedE family protein n=1 Tax=Sphingobacterium shayense TaxID=626343 RepID=UPI00155801EB|nr:YeeE/YedE thiosulfate transporter family protein [Sphingobacterium shayense]NQD71808.1 YeeE/YedE family protein [Sphingobacterium shayense]
MDWLYGPWPWYVGGAIVGLVMIFLIWMGKSFGFSSNFRTICSALGAGRTCAFFDFNWKAQKWNLLFLLGAIIGGFLSAYIIPNQSMPDISPTTIERLQLLGITSGGESYYPTELFGIWSFKNVSLLILGGILVGFGTRYAGGCTSGHAISGLSDLQLPSLIAVIGFFIGGLFMVHVLFPLIFTI